MYFSVLGEAQPLPCVKYMTPMASVVPAYGTVTKAQSRPVAGAAGEVAHARGVPWRKDLHAVSTPPDEWEAKRCERCPAA